LDLLPGVGRLQMPEAYEIGQYWTGSVTATELAMSIYGTDCMMKTSGVKLESRPTSLWSFWI
jgi:hypothetical protein